MQTYSRQLEECDKCCLSSRWATEVVSTDCDFPFPSLYSSSIILEGKKTKNQQTNNKKEKAVLNKVKKLHRYKIIIMVIMVCIMLEENITNVRAQ